MVDLALNEGNLNFDGSPPDLEFVKNLHRQEFSGENFTQNGVNYHKCPIITKQQKNEYTFVVFTLDNLIRVILPR